MFTTGRIIFALTFLVAFIIVMIWAYYRDRKQSPWMFKGAVVWWIILGLIVLNIIFHLFGKT